jgi:hypothetical protein
MPNNESWLSEVLEQNVTAENMNEQVLAQSKT